tara:strand:- start:69 stop:551 length:483 start_codon:yes stop_codon:yes gene_type:complete
MVEKILWFGGFVAVMALSRIIPHPPNFTPILAVAIFAPYVVKDKLAVIAATLLAMFVADLYWGLHSFMLWTYSSIALCTLLSTRVKLLPMLFLGPIMFFVITNFAVWTSGYYGYTFSGLLECYIAAIPFFQNTLLGTTFYFIIFYGVAKVFDKKITLNYI